MFSTSAHWVVTGGAGFVGSHLVRELVRQGQQVTVLDNLSSGNLQNLEETPQVRFIKADICRFAGLVDLLKGADYVLHQAAQVSVAQSVQDPEQTMRTNVQGTENILEAALQAGVKKVVLASSSAVYGNGTQCPYKETASLEFKSPYALSKYLGEKLCRHYTEVFGLHTVILRAFNIFGPRQNIHTAYAAVVAKFMQIAREGVPFPIDGDGTQQRDFVHVRDVVQANLLAITKGRAGEAYNVASGKTYSLLQLAELIEKIAGKKLGCTFGPRRAGDVDVSSADIGKLKSLGYKPSVSLEEGLREMWQQG